MPPQYSNSDLSLELSPRNRSTCSSSTFHLKINMRIFIFNFPRMWLIIPHKSEYKIKVNFWWNQLLGKYFSFNIDWSCLLVNMWHICSYVCIDLSLGFRLAVIFIRLQTVGIFRWNLLIIQLGLEKGQPFFYLIAITLLYFLPNNLVNWKRWKRKYFQII